MKRINRGIPRAAVPVPGPPSGAESDRRWARPTPGRLLWAAVAVAALAAQLAAPAAVAGSVDPPPGAAATQSAAPDPTPGPPADPAPEPTAAPSAEPVVPAVPSAAPPPAPQPTSAPPTSAAPTPPPTSAPPTKPPPTSTPKPPPVVKPVYRYVLAPATARSRPGVGNGVVVHRLARGAQVQLVQAGPVWSHIRSGARHAWIRSDGMASSRPAPLPRNPRSSFVLVNKKYPLVPAKYAPKTVAVAGVRLTPAAAKAHAAMVKAAARDGVRLRTLSGYRSYATQASLFAHYQRLYGTAYASRISARPGTSEHQTGLAVDFGAANGQCRLLACFGSTREGKWLAANAARHGFILRYPRGAEAVTGYSYEPWHYRFVGAVTAGSMKSQRTPTYEQHLYVAP
ncbi:M15 family metallopeptidase [Arthrobacter halodurans]|uniref:D-alanyl-D-alanine carboxypeptidase family protein n=1 Tax=Arthrobacter halodurans TaxID=516699 RepID=A0ABV4UJL1_9MICC